MNGMINLDKKTGRKNEIKKTTERKVIKTKTNKLIKRCARFEYHKTKWKQNIYVK
jgi:hypothetical protein